MTTPNPGYEPDRASTSPRTLIIALALMALALLVVLWCLQTPTPSSTSAPADQFSAGRAVAILQSLIAEGEPHPVGSASNDRVRERLIARLQALGYAVETQDTVVSRSRDGAWAVVTAVTNVAARLPGQQDGPAVALMAHYDSVPAGPGAADDTSNVALILEIARIMKEHGPYRNPVIFLLTDGEEIGLFGAQAFVQEHPWAKDVGVVLNLEARGSSGPSIMFETSEDNAWLIDAYAASVARPASNSLAYEVYKMLPNDTDLSVFKAAGLAGLNFAFLQDATHYHTTLDNLDKLDPASVQHQGDCALAVARTLADADLANPPAGNAAYMDVLGRGMIHWPAAWTLPLVLLALALLGGETVWLIRRRRATVVGVLLGFLAALLTVVLAVLLGTGLAWLVSLVAGGAGGGGAPWYAYPLPMRAALWAGALFVGGLAATLLARRAGTWGLGLGVWLLWAILALLLSLVLPGATILVLVPALCAALFIAAAALFKPNSALARDVALIAAALAGGIVWLQMALMLESAVGLTMNQVVTLSVGLVVSTLLPLVALPRGRTGLRRALVVGAAAVMVVAAVAAVSVPTYSEANPQRVNLGLFEDRDVGSAYWFASTRDLPDPLRQQFDPAPVVLFPWSEARYPVRQAVPTSAPVPELVVLSDESAGGERVLQVQMRSPRTTWEIDLLVPIEHLRAVTVAGQTMPVAPADSGNGYYDLWCYGDSAEGWTVTLRFASADPVTMLVVDYAAGLPPESAALLQARPATAVPVQGGDKTVILRRVRL
ncbi:MAG: M20/M25/M40 family metallo-hydrolase [Chloroflexi bacterium]|nr:M20/M25/M40 family metallo-hydrolase [Chloroflexota bacterium]